MLWQMHTLPMPLLCLVLAPYQLLSWTWLWLVASLLGQMCKATAAAHDASVFHHNIEHIAVSVMTQQTTTAILAALPAKPSLNSSICSEHAAAAFRNVSLAVSATD
jgi:hypothetical protein